MATARSPDRTKRADAREYDVNLGQLRGLINSQLSSAALRGAGLARKGDDPADITISLDVDVSSLIDDLDEPDGVGVALEGDTDSGLVFVVREKSEV